jgi:hypothetical protein
MVSPEDLLGVRRGVVIAPAGCGKTQFLVGSVKVNPSGRVLVLTHTRAGVAAIRERLRKAGVAQQSFRVATLDAWSAWLALRFPKTSGFVPTGTAAGYAGACQSAPKRDPPSAPKRDPFRCGLYESNGVSLFG